MCKFFGKRRKPSRYPSFLAGLFLGTIVTVAPSAIATWPASGAGDSRGFNIQGTAAQSGDVLRNCSVYDSTSGNWYRCAGNSSGQITIAGQCATPGATASVSVDTTAGGVSVPASAVTNQNTVCAFNASTTLTVYCQPNGSSATTANGWPIEPSTWRCFPATGVMKCIVGSSSADVRAYGCGS